MKNNKFFNFIKNNVITIVSVIVILAMCVGTLRLACVEYAENQRLNAELKDAWGSTRSYLKKNGELREELANEKARADQSDERLLLLHSSVSKELKKLENENKDLQLELESELRYDEEQNEMFADLYKDFQNALTSSAHFKLHAKAVLKEKGTGRTIEQEVQKDSLLAVPANSEHIAVFALPFEANDSTVIYLKVTVESEEGEIFINNDKNRSSITSEGIYTITIVGDGGNTEAHIVVGNTSDLYYIPNVSQILW